MSVYFQHCSIHVKVDRNKPRRQRLCQKGWIILKWSWCIYSSFQNPQRKPFFPFLACKWHEEAHFRLFQPATLLLVLGFHPWASSVAFSSGMEARLRFSDCPLHLAAKQDGFSFSVHLLPTYFNKSPAKWWTASEIQVMNMPPLWSAEFISEGAKRACTQPQISFSTCIPNIAVAASY